MAITSRQTSLLLCTLCFFTIFFEVETGNFTIDFEHSTFLKDGKPFRYVSGSIHYSRIHPYYWQDRLQKMRAAGLNAIQIYVPWNFHELTPGQFTFAGASDLPHFLTLAQNAGLVVLTRLGPYICGEWEFGGFPAWLLKENKDMIFRTSDPSYITFVDRWYTALLGTLKPYLYENGGPVVMVQIENEYGSYFACDYGYLRFLYQKVRSVLGNNIVIYTTDGDGDGYLKCGTIEGAYATVDFGITSLENDLKYHNRNRSYVKLTNQSPYDPANAFVPQRQYEPNGPLVNSEFYTGWLDHWGEQHSVTDTTSVAKSLDLLLDYGANINMYMFEGGTNFGYTSGANDPPYQPVPTSYDYDAPLNESGDATPKFYAVRDIISKYYELPPGPVPPDTLKGNYGHTEMMFVSTVQDALTTLCPEGPTLSTYPMAMEELSHYYGFILYRHTLKTSVNNAPLVTNGARDRGYVMINQIPQGMLYRDQVTQVSVTGQAGQYLDILVENQGRVGYSTAMNFMRKGLIYNVTLSGEIVTGWAVYPIHLENMKSVLRSNRPGPRLSSSGSLATPSIYVGKVNIPSGSDQPRDTFLDMRPWIKGQAFINDFNLGRYWPMKGPQVTLYVPAPTLTASSENRLFMFELENSPCNSVNSSCQVSFVDVPFIDAKPSGTDLPVKTPVGWDSHTLH